MIEANTSESLDLVLRLWYSCRAVMICCLCCKILVLIASLSDNFAWKQVKSCWINKNTRNKPIWSLIAARYNGCIWKWFSSLWLRPSSHRYSASKVVVLAIWKKEWCGLALLGRFPTLQKMLSCRVGVGPSLDGSLPTHWWWRLALEWSRWQVRNQVSKMMQGRHDHHMEAICHLQQCYCSVNEHNMMQYLVWPSPVEGAWWRRSKHADKWVHQR